MRSVLKRVALALPPGMQQQLKRRYFAHRIRRRRFDSPEPEYARLDQWVESGDCVLDVGANVGHYTARLAELVGPEGLVIALEPIPATFELLVANMATCAASNVTLLNAAASEVSAVLRMSVPALSSGADNYYGAHVTDLDGRVTVLGIGIDSLDIPRRVGLAKIDVEGHELPTLKGMRKVLLRDRPVLIVEGRSSEVAEYVAGFGYQFRELEGSPNRIFETRSSS